jgi:hypothetical protein
MPFCCLLYVTMYPVQFALCTVTILKVLRIYDIADIKWFARRKKITENVK